jgi:triosephosphate isomerase
MNKEKSSLILGNWKMNGSLQKNEQIICEFLASYEKLPHSNTALIECGICPPALYIPQLAKLLENTPISYGAQDVSTKNEGAYTGEISANMLAELGCQYVIVGHSERRNYHNEDEQLIVAKVKQVCDSGMQAVYCVGESFEEREKGQQNSVVGKQVEAICALNKQDLERIIIAYEPVWAIGTGKTATPEQAQEMHKLISEVVQNNHPSLTELGILYGGSVSEKNAAELACQKNINGFLVGGASLKPQSFIQICEVFL